MSGIEKTVIILKSVPIGLLDGLEQEDQEAIKACIGKPLQLIGHDDRGFMELQFHHDGCINTIWVNPNDPAVFYG